MWGAAVSLDLGEQLLRTPQGSYALYAPVASGGFGTVYFGRDLQSNRPVAIKRLHGHLAYQPDVVARFQQEAQRLRGLQHPNIVQVLDDGTDTRGLPFIILEWVEGWTVGALLERSGRFAIAEAVEIAVQVLTALEAAGRRGIVHRDIKPANLMLTPPPDRRVKVMDFGIAKDVLANVGGQYTQIGTIAYMAPEQFTQGPVDARTDLYALGATLYELLTGQRPNGALRPESPTSLRELRPEVEPVLAAVVYRALEKRPADRFENATQMRASLEPLLNRSDLRILAADVSAPPLAPPHAHLAEAYTAAQQAVEAAAWPKAIELLEAVVALDASYRDTAVLLADARRHHTVAELYGEAHALQRTRSWQAVLLTLERIRAVDADFGDPDGLANTAREALARDALAAERRQLALDGLPPGDPSVTQIASAPQRAPEPDRRPDAGRPQRRVGAPIWVAGVAGAAALVAIGVGASQLASGQSRQSGEPTPVAGVQITEVAATPVALVLPTNGPPTESPRVAVPPTVVRASTRAATAPPTAPPTVAATAAPTLTVAATVAPTLTVVPTVPPTVDELWRAALVQLDPAWSHDWPTSIDLLRTFLDAHPGFAPGEEKLYAAYLFYAEDLLATGDVDGAVQQLNAAEALLPQRPDARQTLVALTPLPTATTAPPAIVPKPQATTAVRTQPAAPTQPRTQPAPAQPAPRPPGQAPPAAPLTP